MILRRRVHQLGKHGEEAVERWFQAQIEGTRRHSRKAIGREALTPAPSAQMLRWAEESSRERV